MTRLKTEKARMAEAGREAARDMMTESVARVFKGKRAPTPTPPGPVSKSAKKPTRTAAPKNLSSISEDDVPLRVVTLKATVGEWGKPQRRLVGSADACRLLGDCTDRALRKWMEQGMPATKLPNGELRFDESDVIAWYSVRRMLMARNKWAGDTHLTIERAHRLHLEAQEQGDGVCDPEPMILVPLVHDHPSRGEALRKACEGIAPGELPVGYRHAVKVRHPRPFLADDFGGDDE